MGTVIPKETFERLRRQRRLKSDASPAFGRRFPSQSESSKVKADFPFSLQDEPFQYHEGHDLRAMQDYERQQKLLPKPTDVHDDKIPPGAA